MKYLNHIILILVIGFISCSKEDTYVIKEPINQSKSLKRGVSFSYNLIDDVSVLGKGISWSYNWAPSQGAEFDEAMEQNQIDFCPMAWNGINNDLLREYVSRNPDCEYLLAFNEPNLTNQANMTPQAAAQKWGDIKSIADELGLKIISPAMNYGTLEGYHDPIVWLDEFFSLIPESDVDGIAVHCYMPNAGALKSYIQRFKKYNKPIWLTEFCAWEGNVTPESQQKFMADAINYLEADPDIFRYAWFIPRWSGGENEFPYMPLLKNSTTSQLTELGKIFTQMSTQDNSIYYVEQQIIEAEHYSSISITESIGTDNWVNGPRVRLTTESPNKSLELYNFLPGQWVEYQVEIDRNKEFDLEIRYASFMDSDISIEIDGIPETAFLLQSTVEEFIWNSAIIPVNLKKGKQTIRIKLDAGTFCMNWLRLN